MAALSNKIFLCCAIVVTAVSMMLWDLDEVAEGPLILHPADISHPLLILFVAGYLQCVEAHDQNRGLIKGMLFIYVVMMSILYVFT